VSGLVLHGDALEHLAALPAHSVDAVVADPPYGIGFQGHEWDQPDVLARAAGYNRVGARTTIGRSAAVTAGSYDLSAAAQRSYQAWTQRWALGALRVLKPGGYLVSFGAPRTWHRLTVGLEDAGLEIRDTLVWLFGDGLPKSKNLAGRHQGAGTALKPAWEPIVLARAPLAVRSVQQRRGVRDRRAADRRMPRRRRRRGPFPL
jgi:DNA modification methylase